MKKVIVLILVFLFCFIIYADEKPIISVLDFQIEEGITRSEMRIFISLLTSALFKTNVFIVIDVSERETLLKELEFSVSECSDESCQLEIGRLLAAEAIIIGRIGRFGTRYVLTAKMLQTDTGRTINTVDGMYDTLDFMADDVGNIASKIAGVYEEDVPLVKDKDEKIKPVPEGMVLVEGGKFQMGSTSGEDDEKPVHNVRVTSFYMKKHEVTNKEVVDIYNYALSNGKIYADKNTVKNAEGNKQELLDLDSEYCQIYYQQGKLYVDSGKEKYPCLEITWYGSAAYCNYLSKKEGLQQVYNFSDWSCNWKANCYRLPTEAEWEFAARGGNKSKGYTYPGSNTIDNVAWYYNNSEDKTHPVGTKTANELGLYDMAGNVGEWCWDWYAGSYSDSFEINPTGSSTGSYRVFRGGSWILDAAYCRIAYRNYSSGPGDSFSSVGFRVVRTFQ